MEPVPYEITEEDVDEVLNAHEPAGGGRFPEAERVEMRRYVMRQVMDIDEVTRSALETEFGMRSGTAGVGPIGERPGEQSYDRREAALGAIEDLLIRDGYIELFADEMRAFPATTERDTERDDA